MLSRRPPKKRSKVFLDSSDDESDDESEASYVQSDSEEESEHAADEDAMNDALSVASSASRSSDLFVEPLTQPHQRSIETPMKRPVDMAKQMKRPIDDIQPVKQFVDTDTQPVAKRVDTPVRVSVRKINNTSRDGSLVQDAYEIVSTEGKEKEKNTMDPTSTSTTTDHGNSSESSLKDCAAIICGLRHSKPSQPAPECPPSIENNGQKANTTTRMDAHETVSGAKRDHHTTAKSSMESLPVPEPTRKPSKLRLKIKMKKPSTSQSDPQREMLEQQSTSISKNQNSKAIVDAIKQKKQAKAKSSENNQVIDLVKSPKTVAKKRVLEEWDKAMEPTKPQVDTNTNSTRNTKHTSSEKAEVKTAIPPAEIKKSAGGVKRKKRKIGKQHTAISSGNSASQAKSNDNSIPASTTKNASVAASNASNTTSKAAATKPAPSKVAPHTTIIAQPKPKKKKKTFQQQVLLHMMTTMKPYTLKSLAVELRTTDIALRHLMLSLIDKQAVIRKEVGNKKKKELYWVDLAKATKEMYGKNGFSKEDHQATKEELRKVLSEENDLLRIIKGMESDLSNDDLNKSLLEEEKTVEEMRKRVKDIKYRIALSKNPAKAKGRLAPRGGHFSRFQPQPKKPKTKNQLRKEFTSMRTEWKKRKEKCTDFVEQLADAMEKRPKDIHKLLDIETDEMMGVKIPPKQVDS